MILITTKRITIKHQKLVCSSKSWYKNTINQDFFLDINLVHYGSEWYFEIWIDIWTKYSPLCHFRTVVPVPGNNWQHFGRQHPSF